MAETVFLNQLSPVNTAIAIHSLAAVQSSDLASVVLTWENPDTVLLTKLRLLRRYGGYPDGPYDERAVCIFEDTLSGVGDTLAETYTDTSPAEGEYAYYAIFGIHLQGATPEDPTTKYLITNVLTKVTNSADWLTVGQAADQTYWGWDSDGAIAIEVIKDYGYDTLMYGE